MDASELDYSLPEVAIAQEPRQRREDARLLVDNGVAAAPDHCRVADLPEVLRPGDLLVVNDSRVLPARLLVQKPTGGLDIRATLSEAVAVLTLPTSSRITLSPTPATTVGDVT